MGHEHNVRDSDARFIIDPVTRMIRNASNKKITLIQFDHNSERFTFEIPKEIEGHDMSLCNRVEVHYFNIDAQTKKKNSGVYTVDDLCIDSDNEDAVVCSWLISKGATKLTGMLKFLIRYRCIDENDVETYSWNTAFFTAISVSEGSDADESFEKEYVDVIGQWKDSVLQGFEKEFIDWKNAIETQISADINKWKTSALKTVDEYIDEHSAQWTSELETANRTLGFLSNYVTPQMYGAKGDGVTDDTEAILACFSENYNIFIPRGNYLLTQPIVIAKEGMCVNGENNMSWNETSFVFDGCDGVVFDTNRYTTFSGVSVAAKSEDNKNCGFKFIGTNNHKIRIENCMIINFKYAISDCISDDNSYSTLWNCTFRHIKTHNVEFALYISQSDVAIDNNNFGCVFDDFYSNNGKIHICASKFTFIGCNFGIRQNNYLMMKNNCYCNFINCNFECDEAIETGYCLEFNGKHFVFENCQFAMKGSEGTYLINTGSDLRLMKFISCYSWNSETSAIWASAGSDFGDAGAIIVDNATMKKPTFTGSYYQSSYMTEKGLINTFDVSKDKITSDALYYSLDRGQVEYKNKSGVFADVFGNDIETAGVYPVSIGGGFYLDGGEVAVSGDIVTCNYNRQKNGFVFVANPPIIDGVPIIVLRDESADYKDKPHYAVFRIKMFDSSNGKWVNNTKPFTLKWLKISQ